MTMPIPIDHRASLSNSGELYFAIASLMKDEAANCSVSNIVLHDADIQIQSRSKPETSPGDAGVSSLWLLADNL